MFENITLPESWALFGCYYISDEPVSPQPLWSSVARRRTDLVPTLPARPGRAYSMTRLDRISSTPASPASPAARHSRSRTYTGRWFMVWPLTLDPRTLRVIDDRQTTFEPRFSYLNLQQSSISVYKPNRATNYYCKELAGRRGAGEGRFTLCAAFIRALTVVWMEKIINTNDNDLIDRQRWSFGAFCVTL